MLIISIIVLIAIGVGIFLLTRNKSQVGFSGSTPDVPAVPTVDEEALKQAELDALAQAQKAKAESDALIANAKESVAKADEVLATVSVVETTPAAPKKKKRYYKPKAKKQ